MISFSDKTKGLMSIFGSFIIALSYGDFYTVGGINPYVSSFLRFKVEPWFNSSYIVLINGFFMLGQGSLIALGGYLAPHLGTKQVLTLGAVIYISMTAVSCVTLKSGFYYLLLTYGFLAWIGVGISSALIMGDIMKWFPAWGGTSSSFVNAGFGLGGFIFNSFETFLVNPNNLSPESSGSNEGYFTQESLLVEVPEMFWKVSLLIAALQVIGILMVFDPPNEKYNSQKKDENTITYNNNIPKKEHQSKIKDVSITMNAVSIINAQATESIEETNRSTDEICVKEDKGLSPKEVMKCREFYLIWVATACQMVPVMFLISNYKAYGLTFINDDRYLSIIGSVAAAISCIGKLSSGFLSDRISYKIGLATLSFGLSLCVQVLYAAQFLEVNNKILFSVFFLLGYIMVGGTFGILPSVTAQAFGFKHSGVNFGLMYSSQSLGAFGASFLIQEIMEKFHWTWSFTCCISFTVFSLILCFFMKPTRYRS